MTEEQLCRTLGIDSIYEADDAFELACFEIKNWLKSKPLLALTVKSKLKRLEELKAIEHLFTEHENEAVFTSIPAEKVRKFTSIEWWTNYQSFQVNWYKSVFDSQRPSEISTLISFYLLQKNSFCSALFFESIVEEEVVFGVESDWMELERGFKRAKELNLNTFEEIQKNKLLFDHKYLLELKRLSLLPKYLKNQE